MSVDVTQRFGDLAARGDAVRLGTGAILMLALALALIGTLVDSTIIRLIALILLLLARVDRLCAAVSTRQGLQACLLLTLAALLCWYAPMDPRAFALGLIPYSDVLMMLFSVGLLRFVLQQGGLRMWIASRLSGIPAHRRSQSLFLASTAIAPVLSMGTVSVMGALTAQHVRPAPDAAIAVVRGVLVAMFWAPSFLPTALLLTTFRALNWQQMLAYTLPVVALAALVAIYFTRAPLETDDSTGPVKPPLAPLVLLSSNAVQSAVYIFLLRLPALLAVTLAATVTVLAWTCMGWRRWQAIGRECIEVWKRLAPEVLLFMAAGAVAVVLSAPWVKDSGIVRALLSAAATISPSTFIIVVLPLATLLRIHPIIPFALFSPLWIADMSQTQGYLAWLVYWCLALAISPVSILNLAASAGFDVEVKAVQSHVRPIPYLLTALVMALGVRGL
jgi:hypothetical protein